jgi:hypothetical protein
MNSKSVISILGGGAILLGCFLPAVRAPIVGSMSYFVGDGKIVAAISVAIIILALCKRVGWAALCAALAALVAAVDFSAMEHRLSMPDADNAIANMLVKATSPGEAWAVIAIGVIAAFVAVFIPCNVEHAQPKSRSWYLENVVREERQRQQARQEPKLEKWAEGDRQWDN